MENILNSNAKNKKRKTLLPLFEQTFKNKKKLINNENENLKYILKENNNLSNIKEENEYKKNDENSFLKENNILKENKQLDNSKNFINFLNENLHPDFMQLRKPF